MRIGIFAAKGKARLLGALDFDEWYQASGDELPGPVLVRVATSRDGRLVVTGLMIGVTRDDDEISSRDLRRISTPSIVSAFIETKRARRRFLADPLLWPTDAESAPTQRGRRSLPPEHFEKVAAAYERALVEQPSAPALYVKEAVRRDGWPKPSEATARRWIQQARERGLLGKTTPGKAGAQRRRRRR